MTTKQKILFLITILGITSCKSHNKKETCENSKFYSQALALPRLDEGVDSNSFKDIFLLIENSDYKKAYLFLKLRDFSEEKLYNQNFLIVKGGDAKDYYVTYRLAQSQNDVNKNTLKRILVEGYSNIELDRSDQTNCLNLLYTLEDDYLNLYNDSNDSVDTKKLESFKKYLNLENKSKRVQFLWAQANYNAGLYDEALPFFYNLLKESTYKKQIFETLFDYHSTRSDSSVYYMNLLKKEYPQVCNIRELKSLVDDKNETSFLKEYNKCREDRNINDSIEANVLLTRFYLRKNDLDNCDKLIQNYFKNDSLFSFTKQQIWERGEYYDIFLRYLFLKGQYLKLLKFITVEMGYNEKIHIKSESDFRHFIQSLYKDYNRSDSELKYFDRFYKKNYLNVLGGETKIMNSKESIKK